MATPFGMDDPFAVEQQRAQQSLRTAQEQQRYNAPQAPGMVGRVYVGTHPMKHLAEMLRVYQAGQKEKDAEAKLADVSTRRNKAMADTLRTYGEQMTGAPEQRVATQADYFDEADRASLGDSANMTAVTPERKADPMAANQVLMASQFPTFQKMGMENMMSMQEKQAAQQQKIADQQAADAKIQAQKDQQRQLWEQSGGNPQAFLAAGGDFEFAKTVIDGQGLGKPTVVRTVDTVDPKTGRPVTQGYDANNNPVGPAIAKYVPPKAGPTAPAGYRFKRDGSLEAIPGGPADAKAEKGGGNVTADERKAGSLLTRLRGSQAQLADAIKTNPDAAKPSFLSQTLSNVGLETAANIANSSNRQRVEAAQLDLLDSALTLGTGAAYTKEQLEGYRKSYFPQIGDTPETIRDKEERLKNIIGAAEVAAGRAEPQSVPQFGPQNRPGPVASNAQPNNSRSTPQGRSRIRFDAQGNIIP